MFSVAHSQAVQASRRSLKPLLRRCGASVVQKAAPDVHISKDATSAWEHYAELSHTEGARQYRYVNRRYVPPMQNLQLPKSLLVDTSMGKMSDKHLRDEWTEEET